MGKVLTPEGYKKLKKELKRLKEIRLPEIAEKIKQAKELGDLSENAEYHAAKEEQGIVNGKIMEIETMLKGADIIDVSKNAADIISVGSTIKLKGSESESTFTIVGANETDPIKGKISNESPIGQALLGHKLGDEVEINLPERGKSVKYKVLEIT
ncbi:MAG: hypothetical protein ACD_63C00167G0002 [uncultured bacterium]|nr:MAG: hypothetical protein ACD_63C00167G0002 [uncultured bacterium]